MRDHIVYKILKIRVQQEGPAVLYVDGSKVSPAVGDHLKEAGVEVRPYDSFLTDVREAAAAGKTIWLDPSKARGCLL